MRTGRLAIFLLVLSVAGSACVPRPWRSVADIDPAPLMEIVKERRLLLARGVVGSLTLDFRNAGRRFSGQAYVVAFPDGRFRLEVPTPMGGTLLVMTSDGEEVLAYYPEENRAYRSAASTKSMSPLLPFPLPVDPGMLPGLIMGTPDFPSEPSRERASLLDTGRRILSLDSDEDGVRQTYLFKGADAAGGLVGVYVNRGENSVGVTTQEHPPFLPRDFDLRFPEGRLKGDWDRVALYEGDGSGLSLRLPPSVPVQDLESPP